LLIFPEEFERVKPGIVAFIKGAFQENPFQETPILRGIFFSSGRQEGSPFSHFLKELGLIAERDVLPGTSKGLFLHDFFARIIPKDRKLFVPTQRALDWSRLTRNLGLTSWLALGVSICGLLSYAFVKNLWTLHDIADQFPNPPVITNEIVTDVSVMDRYRQAISLVSKKNRNWWIPRFGLNQSQQVERRLKNEFSDHFKELFQTQFADRMSQKIDNFSSATAEEMFATHIPYLVRRINLLQSRLKGADREKLQAMPQPPFEPLALAAAQPQVSAEIANRFGSLYRYYLVWQTDKKLLKEEMNTLQIWLEHILTLPEINLNWLVFWVNRYHPVEPIHLENFWGADGGSSSPGAVAPAFTLAGKEKIDKLLLETENALLKPLILANKKVEFEGWYKQTYIRAWEEFITDFPRGVTLLKDEVAWQKVAARVARHEGPYFTLLDILAENLQPLAPKSDANQDLPVWINLVNGLKAAQKGEKLLDIAENIPGSSRLTNLMTAKKAYHDYQNALVEFVPSASSREVAFKMANQIFKEDADPGNSAYFKARDAHDQLKATLTMSGAGQDIFWPLMSGPLDFLGKFICIETACHLNTLWDDEVRAEIQGIHNQLDLSKLLFGPDGYAAKFIKGSAEPFVARKYEKGYHAKTVRALSIPFKDTFLAFVTKGAIAGRPTQEEYKVKFVGQPTSANAEARIKPSATLLELECGDEPQRLINLHYPIKKTFIWTPKKCGDVLFQIDVGKLKLTKNYTGELAFAEFLNNFAKGPHEFKPDDFPDQSAALKRLNVRFVRVEYKLSGQWPVINLLHDAPGEVPSTIARCWDQ
jgi:type VI secretion system protein ImpL